MNEYSTWSTFPFSISFSSGSRPDAILFMILNGDLLLRGELTLHPTVTRNFEFRSGTIETAIMNIFGSICYRSVND